MKKRIKQKLQVRTFKKDTKKSLGANLLLKRSHGLY